jgi:hypothetical protein
LTTEALGQIGELYVIGTEICGKPPHERRQVRQARAKQLLDDPERWLHAVLDKLSRKSDTAAAIMYALNLKPALVRYCDSGPIEIDGSAFERRLRGILKRSAHSAATISFCDSMSGQDGSEQTLT